MAESQQNLGDNLKPPTVIPPVTMKVDAPDEDPCKQENDENEMKDGDFKVCSPSRKPSTTPPTNPFATSQNRAHGILKPPQLSLNNSTNTPKPSFVLNPSRLNPSLRNADGSSTNDKKSAQVNGETPKFVPLIQSETKTVTTSTASTTVASSSFVFGQNLRDRVVTADPKSEEPKPSTSLNSNGTTEMLFSSAIKNDVKPSDSLSKETKSLSESAREYEESRASKRKYEEVEVKTGEEGETNILKITCKLFAFDKTSGNWQERGRGVLRLNDIEVEEDHTQSRLVFRTTGSLRVVLNTKIWAEMTVEKASEKSVRFTALDANGEIKVFLAMASIEDSKQMFVELQSRVQKEIAAQKHKKLHASSGPDSGGN